LYLSRLTPNPRRRDVQRDLANCYAMHSRVLSGFPDAQDIEQARERFGVLYRIEPGGPDGSGGPVVLVQSREAPDWSRLPADYLAQAVVKPISHAYDTLSAGLTLVFRLRANPTRRISDRDTTQAERWRGKRVELRREDEQIAWLERKGETSGFRLLTVQARPDVQDIRTATRPVAFGMRPVTGRMSFGNVLFDGRLQVTDAEVFRRTLTQGIGSGKAFGFGLLSVAPAASRAMR
jgi:CRISPR system Cascade subunit CasE